MSFIDTFLSWIRLRHEDEAREHEHLSDVQQRALDLIDAIRRQRYEDGARFNDMEEARGRLIAALNRLPRDTRTRLPTCEQLTHETWNDNFRFPTWVVDDHRRTVLDEVREALGH